MFTYTLIAVVVFFGLLILFVASRPSDFRVTRSISISAPPDLVFLQVNDLHRWEAWSPWEKLDPAMKKTYEGPAAGVGAISRWDGNNQVGAGSSTIIKSQANKLIHIQLEMLRPFKGSNDVEFSFDAAANQTTVSWTMIGKLNFITKAFGVVMSMDKMVGGQFEQGLAQLKVVAEAAYKR